MQQAHEYAASSEGLDVVYKILSTLALTHPMHTVRAAELQRWVASGDYDRILRGEYVRRGPETAAASDQRRLRRRGRLLRGRGPGAWPTRWPRPRAGRRSGRARPSGTRRSREAAGRRLGRAGARALLGAPAREPGRATSTARRAIPAPRSSPPISPFPPTIWTGSPTRPTCTASISPSSAPRCRSRAGWPTGFGPRVARSSDPSAAAAQIEASKAFAKEVMARPRVSPPHRAAPSPSSARPWPMWRHHPEPLVVKASGLAAGKGAVVCDTRAEAAATLRAMLGDGSVRRRRPHRGHRGIPARARRSRSSPSPTGPKSSSCRPPRTTSGCSRETPGPTPAGWGPTARCRWPPRSCWSAREREVLLPALARAASAGARRSPACCTPV